MTRTEQIHVVLEPLTAPMRKAFNTSLASFSELVGASPPDGWPQFPEAFAPTSAKSGSIEAAWPSYVFIVGQPRRIVGNGGYSAGPDETGSVEIGYEIAPAFRNLGLATRAATELVNRAFASSQITSVIAHTLAEPNASNAVLRKVGMVKIAELPNDEVGTVWRWSISRAAWSKRSER